MRRRFAGVFILVFLACAAYADAATIHGSVYDISLNRAENSAVEINSTPNQFIVARNGSYSFMVPNGIYTIKAEQIQKNSIVASAEENISVKQDGNYVIDLILFPDIEVSGEEPEAEINETFLDSGASKSSLAYVPIWVAALLAAIFFGYRLMKRKKEEKTNDTVHQAENHGELGNLIGIIKKEGGRVTQKEIRKQIPLSEAKISLMIAELEHKGIVEKIKKGRGNIIILKKK